MNYSIKPLTENQIPLIAAYWLNLNAKEMDLMGVDSDKLPNQQGFKKYLRSQLLLPIHETNSFCLIWYANNLPIGHCNTNPTYFGKEAYMHFHIWDVTHRKLGIAENLLPISITYFFKHLKLQKLYCQPKSTNPGPNRLLQKLNHKLVQTLMSVPGDINSWQEINKYEVHY